MNVICSLAIVLLSLTWCQAQDSNRLQRTPDADYTRQFVRLLTDLQKNPWQGWASGTEVVVRYLGSSDAAAKPFAYVQPDMVFRVLEADRLITVTQIVNGKPHRQEHLVKNQAAVELTKVKPEETKAVSLDIDGFTVSSLLWESSLIIFNDGGGGIGTTKEWRLASHPALLLRRENSGTTWEVASVLVTKKIGDREFQCVKTRGKMSIFVDGVMNVVTTQYLSPEVPGHMVEEVKEFYKVVKGQEEKMPQMIIHQKVVSLKLP